MEKKSHPQRQRQCKAYACFEEPETLKLLNFLDISEDKVIYKGITQDQGRKHKDFEFESVSFLTDKLRHNHQSIIQAGVNDLFKGKDSTVLILGNDESKKQKILIGESQNQGFLLQFLATLFDTCYQREIDDKVTIKLSCWEHRDGKINDLLGGTSEKTEMHNWMSRDMLEGIKLVGIPEIMIQNIKSALKIIRIFMKSLQLSRENGQETQNLIFTIKVQIDNGYDKHGNVTQYKISRFNIVKLSHPYTAKAPRKHTPWFINLFNYMQAQTLQKSITTQGAGSEDDFSSYLKDALIRSVSAVYCLSVFSNKMNANDCLTSLKFTAYLQNLKLEPQSCLLNLEYIYKEKQKIEGELVRTHQESYEWIKTICSWLKKEQRQYWLQLQKIVANHFHLMQVHNILEFQYANLLTFGCDRLEKYIYSEEVQDYFYAKKVVLQHSTQLQSALRRYLVMRKQTFELETKFIRKINQTIGKIKKEQKQNKQWKYLLNSRLKLKQLFEKLFQLYGAMSTHFFYEKNPDFSRQFMMDEDTTEEDPMTQIPQSVEQIIKQIEKQKQQQKPINAFPCKTKKQPKKRKFTPVDETEMMFMNTNVSFCPRKNRA